VLQPVQRRLAGQRRHHRLSRLRLRGPRPQDIGHEPQGRIEGEEVVLETRDALDGQITPATTAAGLANINRGAVHPLTGPVFVKSAEPGDILEIEFLDIAPQPTAFTAVFPGAGFLRDVMVNPFLVHWNIAGGWATSDQIPGVRIPGAPFMGISAVAPSAQKLVEWAEREKRVIDKGGAALPPNPAGAVPGGPCGLHGLRTILKPAVG
jgi:formamidase